MRVSGHVCVNDCPLAGSHIIFCIGEGHLSITIFYLSITVLVTTAYVPKSITKFGSCGFGVAVSVSKMATATSGVHSACVKKLCTAVAYQSNSGDTPSEAGAVGLRGRQDLAVCDTMYLLHYNLFLQVGD